MANYTILVHNKSGNDHEYVLFNEMPKPNPTPGKGVFQNAYITSKVVTNDTGTSNFQIQLIINAVTGTRSEAAETRINDVIKPQNGLHDATANGQESITDALQANSGRPEPEVAICDQVFAQICQTTNGEHAAGSAVHISIVEGKPKFVAQELKQTCAVDGSFSISLDGSFEFPNYGKFCNSSCCASYWLEHVLKSYNYQLSEADVSQIKFSLASVAVTLMIAPIQIRLSPLSPRNLIPPTSSHLSLGTMFPGEVVLLVKRSLLRRWALLPSLSSTEKALTLQMLSITKMAHGPYHTFERP